jgi:hypothetical protein
MNGMLNLYVPNKSLDERNYEILEYITTFFDNIDKNDTIYILDPYFEFSKLCSAQRNRQYEQSLSVMIITWLLDANEIHILTKKSLDQCTKNDYPVKFSHPEDKSCNILVARYCHKRNQRSQINQPLELHDRWIIRKNNNISSGLHFGSSLDGIVNKDVTITVFDNIIINKVISRFEELWEEAIRVRRY